MEHFESFTTHPGPVIMPSFYFPSLLKTSLILHSLTQTILGMGIPRAVPVLRLMGCLLDPLLYSSLFSLYHFIVSTYEFHV